MTNAELRTDKSRICGSFDFVDGNLDNGFEIMTKYILHNKDEIKAFYKNNFSKFLDLKQSCIEDINERLEY